MPRPIILGVVGDSAAGKTTITRGLVRILGEQRVTHIALDDYHRYDRRQRAEHGFGDGDFVYEVAAREEVLRGEHRGSGGFLAFGVHRRVSGRRAARPCEVTTFRPCALRASLRSSGFRLVRTNQQVLLKHLAPTLNEPRP